MTTLITAYTMGGLITFGAEILCKISNDVEAGLPVNIVPSNAAKMPSIVMWLGTNLIFN
jgi:hypothetical protein